MGSSGSGSFSDYSGIPISGSGNRSSGGSSGSDKCQEAFTVSLEDVASHDYYLKQKSAPPLGTELTVMFKGRVLAVAGTDSVGSLPTKLNYLARCLRDGINYKGIVTLSTNGPNPQVHADFVVA